MYQGICEYAIANIIDFTEVFDVLVVVWTILYDKAKPLKHPTGTIKYLLKHKNVEHALRNPACRG
jgi:hypothetical protein